MRLFTCLLAVVALCVACSVAAAGNTGEPVSVLVQQPTAVVVTAAPAAVVAPACVDCVSAAPASVVCLSGKCQKLYSTETTQDESCRHRLFGGHVVRKSTRTVVKPVRR